ncbi:Hypothetical_protein [Hexamita inflata]|uniref:Hypothetical_protein n=1 Tax=Hexamita inflata TaxID=28002 RepID=A0AA86N6H1_9EUKA|nr:Hypothetical protein HINF_LOCUS1542 [Hexamita inflata]
MIFAVVVNQVRLISWAPTMTYIYQLSNDDVLDFVQCDSAVYQVMKDGTVQMKGYKKGLTDNSLSFVKLDFSSVSRVFCQNDQQFSYLTQSGQLMVEDGIEQEKLKFKKISEHVLDYTGLSDVAFILTAEGLFVKGDCKDLVCGVSDTTFGDFTQILFATSFTSPIVSLRIHDGDSKNLFLYLENGDVYLTGKIGKFPIVSDSVPIRKIGSGFKSAYLGWNATVVQNVIFYIKGTDLMMYSSVLTPTEQLVQTGVRDIVFRDSQFFMLKKNVEVFYETSKKSQGVDLYCEKVPSDPLCIKIKANTFDQVSDCPDNSKAVCLIKTCIADYSNSDCVKDPCANTDLKCWAIECNQDSHANTPQCFIQYQNVTTPIMQSQNSYFRGFIMFSDETKPKDQNYKVSPGGAAGIAIAACVVFFVIILTIVIVQLKRKQVSTQITNQESPIEVTIAELTTAQTIEAQ